MGLLSTLVWDWGEFEPLRGRDVMGTDGLLDNMFSEDICHIVKMITESSSEPEQAAWAIAEHAYNNSVDSLAPTPFTQAAVMAGKDRLGGKADDITVIVAYVVVK
ncbi:hypothetical protein C3L33_16236, partial [Rhododendron williamsianum]